MSRNGKSEGQNQHKVEHYRCLSCDQEFESARLLQLHSHSKPNLKFKTNSNPKNPADLLRHMCEYCGYRTRISGNLIVHKRRHTGEKPFPCRICKADFVSSYQLKAHSEQHLDAQQRRKRYKCEHCSVGFLSAKALHHHQPLHLSVKRYRCPLCTKLYAQASGYAQHKRWHRQQYERVTSKIG